MPGCVLFAVALSVVLLGLYAVFRRGKLKAAVLLLIPTVVIACTLYFYGYLPAYRGAPGAPTAFGGVVVSFLRAVFSTARMFLGNDDYGPLTQYAVGGSALDAPSFIILFWACHVSAMLITVLTVLSVFGARLVSALKRTFAAGRPRYILFGVSDKALCLARDISAAAKKGEGRRALVVFIGENAGADVRKSIYKLGAVIPEEDMFRGTALNEAALRKAGLKKSLRRYPIYVVAFTESDALNLSVADGVMTAAAAAGIGDERLRGIYVYTGSDAVAETLEAKREALTAPYRYHLSYFNEADLAARMLFEARPPYKRLRFGRGAALPEPAGGLPVVTVVVLGFGQTGRQVLRQAVLTCRFAGCAFYAAVIDRRAETARGAYQRQYPGLFRESGMTVEFHQDEIGGAAYYGRLEEIIRKTGRLDYVVACLGDDGKNFETIADLGRLLAEGRLVCGRLPVLAAHVSDKRYRIFKGGESAGITLFGDREELFTRDIVIREKADILAGTVDAVAYGGGDWAGLPLHVKNSNRAAAAYIGAFLHMMGIGLVGAAEYNETEDAAVIGSRAEYEAVSGSSAALTENLARTEHLRWNAYHFASGWLPMPLRDVRSYEDRKDAVRKLHACLVPWEELEEVGAHILRTAAAAGVSGGELDALKESCRFREIDLRIVSRIYDIISAYNTRVEARKRLYMVRRTENERL